jgi:iron uptake system component EfeO
LRTTRLLILGAASLATLSTIAACGKDGDATSPAAAASGNGKIAVTATDTECKVAKGDAGAGSVSFKVTNNGSKVTEFYVYAAGDRVMGEVENIPPGVSRELLVELEAGDYQTACKPGMAGKGIRNGFKVSGSKAPADNTTELKQATDNYQRYIQSQTSALKEKTGEFVAAVKAGDLAKAKALYPVARTYYERIEPVAEIFGELDPAIDIREADLPAGQEFTGFHRLEKDLWVTKDVSKDGAIADKLVADVGKIVDEANKVQLKPVQLANGAKELLDEVATGKITGEEDTFSHTDLWDFQANLEGSQAAISALRPVIDAKNPELAKTLDDKFQAVLAALQKHRQADGWKLYTSLTQADLRELTDTINALAEPISKVAAAVTQ